MDDSPFDVFGAVRQRRAQMFRGGSAYADPGYIPDTGNMPTAPASQSPNPQQQLDEEADEQGQAALAQKQRQDALDQAAQQKAQDAQTKQDQANWQAQARADAANDKQDGIVTRAAVVPGPDGRDITVQARTQNPDGTTAYKPEDMGIQTLPDGSAYRVNRDQWGRQNYTDPYQAGVNANVALNPNGQVIATPKGKGAANLPKKDVTTQGVTGLDAVDANGNPDPTQLKVSPNAPINDPSVVAGINQQEDKLVKSAAAQRVNNTLKSDLDDATQAKEDAYSDHMDAQTALADAKAALKEASDAGNEDATTKAQAALAAAQTDADQKSAARTAARRDFAMKQSAFNKARVDPLSYLQSQTDAAAMASESAKGNIPSLTDRKNGIDSDQAQFQRDSDALDQEAQAIAAARDKVDTSDQKSVDAFNARLDAFHQRAGELQQRQQDIGGRIDAFNSDLATVQNPQPSPSGPISPASAPGVLPAVPPAYQGFKSQQLGVMAPPPGFDDHHDAATQLMAAHEAQGSDGSTPIPQPGAPAGGVDPNSVAGLVTGAYGQPPAATAQPGPGDGSAAPPPAAKGTWGSWLKNAATVGTADFEGSVGNIMKGIGGAMDLMDLGKSLGLYKLEEPLAKSLNTPEGFQKWKDAVEGPNLVTKAGDQIKDNATALASGIPLSVLGKPLQVDPNRTGTSVVGGIASAVPQMASGPFEVPLWMNSGYQDATDESKKAGDPWYVTQAKGIVGAVTMGGVSKLFSAFGAAPAKFLNPVLFGSRQAADQTTTPLLKVLMGGATATTTDLLKRVAMLAGKGGVEGAGFSVGGQVARGDNPFSPKDASANTNEDLNSAASLAVLNSLFGGVMHGRSLAQISSGVDDLVKRVNAARANAPDGQPPQPPVDRATVLANLIQQNQAARARQSFTDLQKQFETIDGNDTLTAGQKLGAKMKVTAALPAELRPAILAHLDASSDAQRQVDEAMQAADAEQAKLPPADPVLAHRSDGYIQANRQDILQSQQTGQPRQRQLIGNETDAGILSEADRRQQLADLNQQRQQVVAGIASNLKDSLDQTVALSGTPEGRSALLSLNRYNAGQPAGMPKASATTAQSALDIAPMPNGNVALPSVYVEHYLPLAHQIEQLGDPDQQAVATAAVKITNGRALTPDEQSLMLGDPTTGQPGAVDATTGKPLAMVANGKPLLTNAGLDRLRTLVPAAAEVLPRNEQAQLEAQPPPLPATAKGRTSQPVPNQPPALPGAGSSSQVPTTNKPRLNPDLAHLPTEALQTKIGSMQAAMANAKARGGNLPASAQAELTRVQQEVDARSRQSAVADNAAFGAPAGHQVDETIAFTHPGPDGKPIRATGDVTEVHPNFYRVATEDGTEHRVAIIRHVEGAKSTPASAQPRSGKVAAENRDVEDFRTGKADAATTKTRLRNLGLSDDAIQKRMAQPAAPGAKSEPGQVPRGTTASGPKLKAADLPGVDVSAIKPEHAEAARLVGSIYDKVRATAKVLGITGFKPASHPKGMIGLGVHPDDLTKIELDLPRLTQELAKLPTPAARQARVEEVLDEELRHVALETVAGEDNGAHSLAKADATFARLWASASPFQKRTAIDLYDKGALAFVDPDGAAKNANGTLKNASDANKGREYLRMLSQLQARGRTSEIADLVTPETKTFFQKVVDYLRHVFAKVNDPAAKQLLDRTEDLLQAHANATSEPVRAKEEKPPGSPADIALPNGDTIPAKYEVAELGDIQPSHRNGSPNPAYPPGLNERDYSLPAEKAKNEGIVSSFDPRRVVTDNPDAVNGPPIVDKSGIVLGGNRRAIMLSDPRAYAKYKPYLQDNAARFGINPDDVAKMQQPVLIRRVDTPAAQRPELIRRLNETPTGGIDTANDAVSAGKQITPDLVKSVSDLFQQDPDKSPLQHLSDGDTKAIAQGLLDAGAIRPNDREKYVSSNGNLSPEGARFARSVLLGGILPDAHLLREINDSPTQTKLLNGLSPIYTMKARGVDISPLQEGVSLEADRQRLGIKNVVEHQAQGNLTGIGKESTTEGKTLQSFLAGIKGNEARRAFTQLQNLVAPLEPGQTGLFGESNRHSLADVTDAEINKVLAGAKKVTKAAEAMRKAGIGGAAVTGASYPGPLKIDGMAGLHPDQARVESRFAGWLQSNPDRAAAEYAKIPDAEGGRVIDMDIARTLSPDYRATRRTRAMHSVSVQKVVNALAVQKLLPDAGQKLRPGDVMGLTAGGPGSGKGNIKKVDPRAWYGAKFVYDGVLRSPDFANQMIADATAKGAKTAIWYVHSPVEKAVEQAVGRAEKDGRSLPLFTLSSGHVDAQRTMIALLRQHVDNPNVEMRVFDNSGPSAVEVPNPLQFLTDPRILYRDLNEALTRSRAAYETVKGHLTDPVAREVFETGTYRPETALHEPPEQRGGRSLAGGSSGSGERGASAPGDTSAVENRPGGPVGGASVPEPLSAEEVAQITSDWNSSPFASTHESNVRGLYQRLKAIQSQGKPFNKHQQRLFDAARDRLAITEDGRDLLGGARVQDTGTGNLFDQPETPAESQTRVDEAPLSRAAALNIYRDLSPRRQAGETLNAGAARLLERAEQALGQTFIPGLDETSSTRTGAKAPPPTVNFGKPETGIRAELRTEGPDMFGAKPPGQQSLFGSGVRDLPMDLPGQRNLGLSDEEASRRPGNTLPRNIEVPLRRYVNALHQADLDMGLPGQRPLDFRQQYQTDFGAAPDNALVAGARRIQTADGIASTPQDRFEGNLDLADRLAAHFTNTPGTDVDDLRQVARVALYRAASDNGFSRGKASRIIRNALIDHYRKQSRRAVEQPTLDAPQSGSPAQDNVPAREPLASQAVARTDSHAVLRSEVSKLPDGMRQVAEGLLAGKSKEEIASERGYSHQRASFLAAAALSKLRTAFEAKGIGRADLVGGTRVDNEGLKSYLERNGVQDRQAPAGIKAALAQSDLPGFERPYADAPPRPATVRKTPSHADQIARAQVLRNPADAEGLKQAFATGDTISSILPQYLTGRIPAFDLRGKTVESPSDFAKLAWAVRSPYVETLKVAVLNGRGKIVHSEVLNVGTLNESLTDTPGMIRAIQQVAAKTPARRVIVSHNHPSGDPTPSDPDMKVTRTLESALKQAGVELVDHVITNGKRFASSRGGWRVQDLPDGGPSAWEAVPREDLVRVDNDKSLAPIVRALRQSGPDHTHIVYLNTKLGVTAIERAPAGQSYDALLHRISNGTAREGAAGVLLATNDLDPRRAKEMQRDLRGVAKLYDVSSPEHDSFVGKGLLNEAPARSAIGGAGVRPPNDPRSDREASLTPEELREEQKARVAQIKSSLWDASQKPAQLKRAGMEFAAKMRFATGNLTAIEAADKAKFEASNYQGKPVSFEGREATVVGQVFGKVKLKFADGSTKNVPPDAVEHETRAVHGAGVRAPLNFDLGGQSMADAKDAFDRSDVDTWPVSEEEKERLRPFTGDLDDDEQHSAAATLVDDMRENSWPDELVAKAEQLRDAMEQHHQAGKDALDERADEAEEYLNNPDRQTAYDTDLDDTDTWPQHLKDQWDDLDLSAPATWPAGMEADARRDGAITETPVDEDEPHGDKDVEVDQDYAQEWMADHLVAPEVRRAMGSLADGPDIEQQRRSSLLDSLARNQAESELRQSPERNALDQATNAKDSFARGLAEARGLKGYGPYVSGNKLNIHEEGKGWTEHPLSPDEAGKAEGVHRAYGDAWRAHDSALDARAQAIRPQMEATPPARWDDSRVADWKRDNAPEGDQERTVPTQGTLFGAGVTDEQRQRALAKYALGFDQFARQDVVPTARTVADGVKTAGDGVLKLFAPQLRGENAASTARSLTTALAEHAQRFNQAVEWTKGAHQMFDRMTPEDNNAFMDAVEQNTKLATPELESVRKLLSSVNHGYVELVRSMPGSQFASFVTHYLPHIWDLSNLPNIRKDFAEILRQRLAPNSAPGSASLELHPGTQEPVLRIGNRLQTLDTNTADGKWARDLVMAKNAEEAVQRYYQRKIEGSTAFLKHRVLPSIAEGRALGLRLVSNNPVDLYLTRWNQMGKFAAGQQMINELKEKGIAQHFADPNDVPPGWRQVDNKLGLSTETYKDENTGKVKSRSVQLYAPGEVVDLLDNYLSPGLRNHENDLIRGGFKVINGLANVLNSAQLGFSAFHLGFTTVDAATSKLAVAIEHAMMGDMAGAAKHAALAPAQFLSPVQMLVGYVGNKLGKPEWDTHMGSKMLREYYSPGSQGSEIGQLVNAYVQGGGRATMDPLYTDQWMKSLGKAWRQGNLPGALARLPFATLEAVMKPIMEYVVPRQKLAAFADLALLEMKKLGPNATQDDVRAAMQKAEASISNRMGQLTYDNLHWNKTVKDLAMITTRSVGWNVGTGREILGAGVDAAKFAKNIATGQKAEFTHKMAYVVALHLLLAGMGGLAGYLLTGRRPETLTDLFFPKTGEKDANGKDVRLSFPSYVKDEAAYLHAPGTTLGNKLNPLWSSVLQVIENKDYYGTQIYGPDDHLPTQALDVGKFAAKQVIPFAWSGGNQFAKDIQPGDNVGPLRQLVGSRVVHEALSGGPTLGLTPAAKYLSTSPAEQRAEELESRLHASDTRTHADYEKSQAYAAVRTKIAQAKGNSAAIGQAIRDGIQSGAIRPQDVKKIVADAQLSPLDRMARNIANSYQLKGQGAEGYAALKSVWDEATPEEQASIQPHLMSLWRQALRSGVARSELGPPPIVKAKQPAPTAELSMAQ